MNDTPRTDAAYIASTGAGIYELFKESQDIERELNASNQHIKRLEEAGDALERDKQALKGVLADLGVVGSMGFGSTVKWVQAKEAKPFSNTMPSGWPTRAVRLSSNGRSANGRSANEPSW